MEFLPIYIWNLINLIVILPTNLIIISIESKFMSENYDALGISSYYENLPFGKKDIFAREIADGLGMSTSNVKRRIRFGKWNPKTELPLVSKIIKERGL